MATLVQKEWSPAKRWINSDDFVNFESIQDILSQRSYAQKETENDNSVT